MFTSPDRWDGIELARTRELLDRMFVARGMNRDATTVVGLATEEYRRGSGFSLDAALLEKPVWTAEDQAEMEELQRNTGAFESPQWSQSYEEEYPPPREDS